MVQILNKEQKEFLYHVLHLIKTFDELFYYFLSGGTDVGKSHLTKALFQAALTLLIPKSDKVLISPYNITHE